MDRRTLVIAGASSGLGKAVAEEYAKQGWLVVAGARSFRDDMNQADGICRVHLDTTDPASREHFLRKAEEYSSRIDTFVYAAAILNLGSCELTDVDEYRKVMETCFLGMTALVSGVLPRMRAAGQGQILLFSSINGLLGIPFQSAYTACKHAIEGYAECLSMEVRPMGIRVSLIEPGDHAGGSDRTRLHAAGETEASPYHDHFVSTCAKISGDEHGGLSPQSLAEKVYRYASRKHPPFRMRIAKPDQKLAVFLHVILPERLNAKILSSYYFGSDNKQKNGPKNI